MAQRAEIFPTFVQYFKIPMLFLSFLFESIRMAWHSLSVNKLRTVLSLLGITIGILAIISVFTVVDSMENYVRKSVSSLGDNVIYVQKWPWTFGADYPWWKYWQRPLPTPAEMDDLDRRCQSAEAFSFVISTRKTVEFRNLAMEKVDVVAVSHGYAKIREQNFAQGRYFTPIESDAGSGVALVGTDVADNLIGGGNPIGKYIKLAGRKFAIIGVYRKEGKNMFGNTTDNQVIIPLNYARNIFDIKKERFNPFIMAKARNGISNEEMREELTGSMRALRRIKPGAEDNFALNELTMLSENLDGIFTILGIAGWIIGGFSILVGGFSIANIMFVSVKERTPQIGIQKSLGAKNYFILLQFLSEAIILSLIGGAIGLIIVYGGSVMVSHYLEMDMTLTSENIIMGIMISAIIGLLSGIIPAWFASRLDPVEAIRAN